MPAGAVAPARWTPSCGESASNAGCGNARRQGCGSNVSAGEGAGPGRPLSSPGASAEACVSPPGVLSKEQIRKKKIRKQQQQQSSPTGPGVSSSSSPASGSGASPGGSDGGGQGSGEGEGIQLTAAQELMIQQLVAAQLQCNKRSFSDQPKVTVRPLPQSRGMMRPAWSSRQGHSPGHRERMRLQRTGALRQGRLGLTGDMLIVTCPPPVSPALALGRRPTVP